MLTTIKARYHRGKIEPLEPLDIEDGIDLLVTVKQAKVSRDHDHEARERFFTQAKTLRQAFADVSAQKLDSLIDQAVADVRAKRRKERRA